MRYQPSTYRHLVTIALVALAAGAQVVKAEDKPAVVREGNGGTTLQQGSADLSTGRNKGPTRLRERATPSGNIRPPEAVTPDVGTQRGLLPPPALGAQPTPVLRRDTPAITPPMLKLLPGALPTPPLIVTGVAAPVVKMPAAVSTSALAVTGVAESPPTLPSSIATPGLAVTGVAP